MEQVAGTGLRLPGVVMAVALGTTCPAGSTQARDMPKSEPPPRMMACDSMGPGFVKLEGSDVCVKMSGSMRVEFAHDGGSR